MRTRPIFAIIVIALTLLCAAPLARAQAPVIPPDVQAILDKLNNHQQPTAADMARLQQWQQDVMKGASSRGYTPPSTTTPATLDQGVPVRIEVKIEYTTMYKGLAQEQVSVSGWFEGAVTVQGSGDDGFQHAAEQNFHGTSYSFGPPRGAPFGATGTSGGTFTRVTQAWDMRDVKTTTTHGGFVFFACPAIFETTGRGDGLLAPISDNHMGVSLGRVRGSTRVTERGIPDRTSDYDELAGLDAHALFCFEADNPISSGRPVPAPKAGLSRRALDDAIGSGKTATLTASEPIEHDFSEGLRQMRGTASYTIIVHPTKADLVIEPADVAAYDQWLPTPLDRPEIFGLAKPLAVRARLTKGRGSPEPAAVGGRIDFVIRDASALKGTSTNYPIPVPNPPPEPKDLKFSATQDDGIIVDDEEHAHTSGVVTDATVYVEATDTGAYGKVQAIASLSGVSVTSFYERTGTDVLAVPKDDNENHVADCWEEKYHIGTDKKATWDEEPQNDQRDTGDGLTLFEEYRGFVTIENHGPGSYASPSYKHVRTSPLEKDVFVYDLDELVIRYEFPENPHGLTWHFVDTTTMFWDGNRASDNQRWINPNSPPELRYARQYGIYIIELNIKKGEKDAGGHPLDIDTETFTVAGNTVFRPEAPKSRGSPVRNVIYSAINREASKFAYHGYLDNPKYGACWQGDAGKAFFATCVEADVKLTVMHELGHCVGIRHHEPVDSQGCYECVMRYPSSVDMDMVGKGRLGGVLMKTFCTKRSGATDVDGNGIPSDDCWGQITVKSNPGD